MSTDYAGEIAPKEVWKRLESEPNAVMVDVRTAPEWSYVGLPDLSALGKKPVLNSWQVYPNTTPEPDFADKLIAAGLTPDQPIFFLCRSGVRSLAAARLMTARGFKHCFNITGGFEGDVDAKKHRGNVAGWKFAGLPWTQ
ncbi:MAG: rhodanese-like domain-containing protein [Elsteraceae bacterium]